MSNNQSHIIVTDYDNVRLSKSTLSWLDSLDKDWQRISINNRLRSKHAKMVRDKVHALTSAVSLASEIAWLNNESLDEF